MLHFALPLQWIAPFLDDDDEDGLFPPTKKYCAHVVIRIRSAVISIRECIE